MMRCAYDELYLPLAQRMLGDMLDYAVNTLKYSIDAFYHLFLVSGISRQVEAGNPMYLAGMNGCEVARDVIEDCGLSRPNVPDYMYVDKSQEYWIGWAIAYYQWKRDCHFLDIEHSVPITEMYKMYPTYHEMDIESFVEYVDECRKIAMEASRLKRLRQYAQLSQNQLANQSGVPVRQIQLFEQGQRDINKTQGDTLRGLSKALGCEMEELLQ